MSIRAFLAAGVGAVLLSACAGEKLVGRPGLTTAVNSELPPPGAGDLVLQQRSYFVGPLDTVTVDVYGVQELSRTVQVDAGGQLVLPLAGSIPASGKSAEELGRIIEDRLRKYVRDPQVTVSLKTSNQIVTVDGQVEKPGLYPVIGRMTLMRAVASAEGMNEYASANHVVVFRRVGGKDYAALYDVRAIRQGLYPDPEIYANDLVYVGESGGRRVFQALVQSSTLLTAPLVAILN